ncbi:hypothetical protein TanjilG_16759 [Lupinus angustifolius]|uniref:VQ domain-containing protein n=1 Tax=Lupinus angustifolius TaxID=3871 RepID=A0A4P1QZU2_LUPAN|nr:PREDICTED: serine/threonine-protein kinase DDB_G0283821 [Lupinus angustifolius]OIV98432.1 hypothetical protein TanjilG_16759 [Lupinus angustifolius]
MDSGNSGSMQSSSTGGGGDEEYDSRVQSSLSAFLDNDSSLSLPSSLPLVRHVSRFTSAVNTDNGHMLEYPLSNYIDQMQRSHQNSNLVWSKTDISEANQYNVVDLIPSSVTSSSSNQQGFLSSLGQTSGVGVGVGVGVATFPTTHHSSMHPPQESASRGLLLSQDQGHNNNKRNNSNMVRNPKKRSRASRRAPTTVLTTDTTNFRAMVQEFTGIPAPPFTSSPFQRTRLDLFGSSSTIRSLDTLNHGFVEHPHVSVSDTYLLRPFAQKLHPFPPSSTSSIPISMLNNNNKNTLLGNSNHSSSNISTNPTQFMMNMHNNVNPILSLESILQGQQVPQNSKYPLDNSSKTQPPIEIPNTSADNSHLKMSVLEELGLSQAHVNNIASSSSGAALSSRINNNNNNNMGDPSSSSSNWVQRTGTSTIINNNNNNGGDDDDDHGNYTNNIHHGEKKPECGVAARNEGMVESWINCSSD